jgi:glycosyltransferase involved in cell wall biosynthesis
VDQPKVWIDVSAAIDHRYQKIQGVPRLVLETPIELAQRPGVRFMRFDRRQQKYRQVTIAELIAIRLRLTQHSTRGSKLSFRARLRMWLVHIGRGPAEFNSTLQNRIRRAIAHFQKAQYVASKAVLPFRFGLALVRGRGGRSVACLSKSWRNNDVIIFLGYWNQPADLDALDVAQKRSCEVDVKIARLFHDIIPLVRPQFTGRSSDSKDALIHMLTSTDLMLTNSQFTRSDIERFCVEASVPIPSSQVIRMASSVSAATPVQPRNFESIEPFVLCVGTIEIRKNHHLLFDVWEDLLAENLTQKVPTLVLAGSLGWINTETVSRLRHTPGFDSLVQFVEAPTDSELAWLYRNCLFTVYPSLYEGWGYPITESLDSGKVCVTSNVSSMPQAAQGLGILLDPRDRHAWRETIVRLTNNPHEIGSLEERIRTQHTVVTARDSASDIWTALSQLRDNTTL